MTGSPITVNHTNNLREVKDIFDSNDIHHLPVVSGEKLIGLLSKTDIERISFVSDASSDHMTTQIYDVLSIEQVMTKDLTTFQEDQTIKEAAETLATGRFHALPILSKEKVVGIVTTTDLLNYLLEQY